MKTRKNSFKNKFHRARYERFGGIVSYQEPPMLAWVDRAFMADLGYAGSHLWSGPQRLEIDGCEYLSAPTEVHFAVTGRCAMGCAGCYLDAQASGGGGDLPLDAVKVHLKTLADMGVFHVALGGGEAFDRPDFGDIVEYCRDLGLVPNCTTNGQEIGDREIAICKKMGRVNVSIDGVRERYGVNGRNGSFAKAKDSLVRMEEAGIHAGINCVVSSRNFGFLEDIVSFAADIGCPEVEFLKYKPSGRGQSNYDGYRLDQRAIRSFYPTVCSLAKRYPVELKIDCSFVPAMVHAHPPLSALRRMCVTGCDGGNLLLAARSNGVFSGCSFVNNCETLDGIASLWPTSPHLNAFRNLARNAAEPCRSCRYLSICRCGCRAVALHETGDFFAPDPECPRVYDYSRKKRKEQLHAKIPCPSS